MRWAGPILVLLGLAAVAWTFRREKTTAPVLPGIMPAFGACPGCERMVPVTVRGGCSMCGNKDVVIPYSDGARLTMRDNAETAIALDRKRFRRGGQTA